MKRGCKEYADKIILFDDLDEKEKRSVQSHLEECEDCRAYFESVTRILHSLRSIRHLADEQLTRFIVSENFPDESDFDGERLSDHKALEIKSHLRTCRLCSEKYEKMRTEFEALESFVDESLMPKFGFGRDSGRELVDAFKTKFGSLVNQWKSMLTSPRQKFVIISATGIAVLLVMILFIPIFTGSNSKYYDLAKLENTEITFLTRGATTSIQSGVSHFNEGNYSLAVEELGLFILEHPQDPNREMAEYVCGLSYLFLANKTMNKKIESLQNQNLEKGIEHLQTVLSISANQRLQEDCNWYIGKACLMKRDVPTAISYFEKVQNSKGRKAQKAKEILLKLKK